MHHLSIDIETYSSVPLPKSGMYKYVDSADFEILLFAYSLDGAAVQLIDLASGAQLPAWMLAALSDPSYTKHAYNAAFEWRCLSKFMGELPINQWRCTMMQGLYCGFPAGLAAVGAAVGLPEDKQKLSTGKALIRYFCVPCTPTKTNGGRTRNRPTHDAARWELFKQYCVGDVVAESDVLCRLSNYPVPQTVQKQWETDQIINARGVAVDMELVHGALQIGERTREQLVREAVQVSGISNPNSLQQLTAWIEKETGEGPPDLRKETVRELLRGDLSSDAARRMLEIRQELGKTSTKKYNAIEAAVCADGRVRGLLQFYGANRTGRWAGRLVQVQNLPRTYTDPLPLAREAVKKMDAEKLRALYGCVPDTLSQLIRTALVAAPDHVLIDADFASIEARVIAWWAGEHWRLDVFRTHGKIYEASASQMFGVPLELIVKGNPEYELRQRGKVAELALGYQGSVSAMRAMDTGGKLAALSDDEVRDIVNRWRESSKRIRDLWYAVESAALSVIQGSAPVWVNGVLFAREIDTINSLDFMTIRLPSGRKLYYVNPSIGANRWGKPSPVYFGVDKKWGRIESYGGKLVENVVQAIARDCLAEAIERLAAAEYAILFHVHDEVVIECPVGGASLDAVTAIMSAPMPWAPDLPLGADGWVGDFYRKD